MEFSTTIPVFGPTKPSFSEEDRRQNPVLYQLMSENSPEPDTSSIVQAVPQDQISSQELEQATGGDDNEPDEPKDTTIESVQAMETDIKEE